MVGAIPSFLPGAISSATAASASPSSEFSASPFGPDFLVSLIASTSTASGAAYNALGQSLTPPADSPAGKQRAALLAQAQQSLQAGDASGARGAAQQILAKNPNDYIAVYYVARSYLAEGDLRKAEQALSRAASYSDDARITADLHAVQTLQRGPDETVARIKRLLASPSTAQEGARLSTYLLNLDPSNVDAHIALADFYDHLGKTNLAGAELNDALDSATDAGRKTLIKRIEQFAQAHTDDASVQALLAQSYAVDGRLDDAENTFKVAQRLAKDDPTLTDTIATAFADVYSRQGRALLAAGHKSDARADFQRALDLAPDDTRRADLSNLELGAGEQAFRAGNLNLALERFDAARESLPIANADDETKQLIIDYETLAGKFAAGGDLKNVVGARNGDYQLDPKNDTRKRTLADANDTYGLSLSAAGDYHGAVKAFRDALQLYNQDNGYAAHLADALSHL